MAKMSWPTIDNSTYSSAYNFIPAVCLTVNSMYSPDLKSFRARNGKNQTVTVGLSTTTPWISNQQREPSPPYYVLGLLSNPQAVELRNQINKQLARNGYDAEGEDLIRVDMQDAEIRTFAAKSANVEPPEERKVHETAEEAAKVASRGDSYRGVYFCRDCRQFSRPDSPDSPCESDECRGKMPNRSQKSFYVRGCLATDPVIQDLQAKVRDMFTRELMKRIRDSHKDCRPSLPVKECNLCLDNVSHLFCEGGTASNSHAPNENLRKVAELYKQTFRPSDKPLDGHFHKVYDFYVRKAAKLFGVRESDVTPDQRRVAKTLCFDEFYGTRGR